MVPFIFKGSDDRLNPLMLQPSVTSHSGFLFLLLRAHGTTHGPCQGIQDKLPVIGQLIKTLVISAKFLSPHDVTYTWAQHQEVEILGTRILLITEGNTLQERAMGSRVLPQIHLLQLKPLASSQHQGLVSPQCSRHALCPFAGLSTLWVTPRAAEASVSHIVISPTSTLWGCSYVPQL